MCDRLGRPELGRQRLDAFKFPAPRGSSEPSFWSFSLSENLRSLVEPSGGAPMKAVYKKYSPTAQDQPGRTRPFCLDLAESNVFFESRTGIHRRLGGRNARPCPLLREQWRLRLSQRSSLACFCQHQVNFADMGFLRARSGHQEETRR